MDIIDIILEEGAKKTKVFAKAKYDAVKNKIGFYNQLKGQFFYILTNFNKNI